VAVVVVELLDLVDLQELALVVEPQALQLLPIA
jgi:hypothetical protein